MAKYVTLRMAEAAHKARVISKADFEWFSKNRRAARNSTRMRELAERVRAWQDAGTSLVERVKAETRRVQAAAATEEAAAPMTALERQHKHRAQARELGEIPACADPRLREKCRGSLLDFGLTFCLGPGRMLNRKPSPRMMRFVEALQLTLERGGNRHVRWPRGKGKSTWVKIAALWALVYGIRRFVVVIAATKPMAEEATAEIWRYMTEDDAFAAVFPEFAVPLRDVDLTPQRMRGQTYRGVRTHITDNGRFSYKRFARLADYPNTGGILAARGADQAIRGLNIGSIRPDFIFVDDPQTDESAKSPSQVAKIEERIQGALLGLGETSRIIAAVMASTPIEPDDVSERFADADRHPEWLTETETFVVKWGPEDWRSKYLAEVRRDNAAGDALLTGSRAFYAANRADIERDVEMMDDGDYDPSVELSAYHHALNMLHVMKPRAFNAEYQMKPTRSQGIYLISPSLVASRLSGLPFGEIPEACDQGVLAFVDVNIEAGLRWELMAFGRNRVTATLAYGRYPESGRLIPEGTADGAIPAYLAPAMRTVAAAIKSVRLHRQGSDSPERVSGICFDGGWQTETVALVVQSLDNVDGVRVAWSRGYDSRGYSRYHEQKARETRGLHAGEWCHTWRTANGVYLAFNADYWREVGQTSFLAMPLQPSSSCLWGSDRSYHFEYAAEVCAETLVAKEDHSRFGTVWSWKKRGANHFGDTHYGCLAFGAIRGNYDPVAKLDGVGAVVAKRPRYVYKAS